VFQTTIIQMSSAWYIIYNCGWIK